MELLTSPPTTRLTVSRAEASASIFALYFCSISFHRYVYLVSEHNYIFNFLFIFGVWGEGVKGRDPKLNLYTKQKEIFKQRLKEVKERVMPRGRKLPPTEGTAKAKNLRQAWRA